DIFSSSVVLPSHCVSLALLASQLACSSQVNITAELGEDVILPCEAPNTNKPIIVVEWSKPEVDQEYVFLYRDGHLDSVYQLPSYRNRVDLQDRQMKDGDVSLVLKDVKKNDTGTYECRVFQRGTNRKKRSNLQTDPIITIYLLVLEPGEFVSLMKLTHLDNTWRRRHLQRCLINKLHINTQVHFRSFTPWHLLLQLVKHVFGSFATTNLNVSNILWIKTHTCCCGSSSGKVLFSHMYSRHLPDVV
uniref:Ig-like domain-containing protein n=1 Tax=Stegastes partitus TaxID=144197 RepID=A0A3B5AVR4_9TELE